MPGTKWFALLAVAALACGAAVHAAETGAGKPMKMDEPMPTKMTKKGMKKGDVKKAAEKRERAMKPMIEKESSSAPKK